MNKKDFLELLQETLDCEEELNEDMELETIYEYDSIGILSLMSMYDDLGIKVSPQDFEQVEKVIDLINLIDNKSE